MSISVDIPVIVILAESPVWLTTDEVTIPTTSPILYPFPCVSVVGSVLPGLAIAIPVIAPVSAFILFISNFNPVPDPVILNVSTEVSIL